MLRLQSGRPVTLMGQNKQRLKLLLFPLPDEAEDDDDPEYNFLEDLDEPDREDYRTDRAVQITSRCFPGKRKSEEEPSLPEASR